MKYAFFCGGSALALAASLVAAPAFAATATDTATDTASSTQPGVVGELMVVAQKREQNIETVPVAVTAFSGKQRDILGIKTTQDLSDFTPGLSYYSVSDSAYIRGIGRNTVNLATASGVATYYNGVYYGANATIAEQHDSLFIGNIEVDNGPQNTLHGSNSDGGTINYVSQKPTHDFYAEARGGFANYGYAYGEAVVSGPINDHLRFRLGGNYSSEDGGFFNNLDGKPEGGFGPQGNGGHWQYVEGQLSANFDHLDIWGLISSGDYDTNFKTVEQVGNVPAFENGEASPLSPSSYFGLCGIASFVGAGCPTGGTPGSVVIGSVTGGPVLANQFPGNNPGNVDPHTFINTTPDANTQNNDVAMQTVWTYHFPAFDLQYTGGYQSFHYDLHFNQTYDSGISSYQIQGPVGFGNLTIFPNGEFTHFVEKDQYYSNEVDALSTGSSPFQWIVGGYQYHEHFDQPISAFCYPNQPQLLAPANGVANPSGCDFQQDGNIKYDDWAGYAHGSYSFTPQWQLAGGFRYTMDHKEGFEQQRLIGLGVAPGFGAADFGSFTPALDLTTALLAGTLDTASGGTCGATVIVNKCGSYDAATGFAIRPLSASWSALTGDVTLNFKPDSETLAYIKYDRGYKSGGFTAGTFSPSAASQAEAVDDFEGGLKKTWGSSLLFNASVFYYNWTNDQQPVGVLQPGGNIATEIINIPSSRLWGVELLGQWKPIDPWSLTLEYGHLDAQVTSMNGQCVQDAQDTAAIEARPRNLSGCAAGSGLENLVGNKLPEAAPDKVSFDSQYTFKFDPGDLTVSASVVWKSATYDSIFNEPQSLAPAYTTVNLRAYFNDAQNRWTLIAYADNLFNSLGYDNVTLNNAGTPTNFDPVSLRGLVAPRTFGLEFQYRWK